MTPYVGSSAPYWRRNVIILSSLFLMSKVGLHSFAVPFFVVNHSYRILFSNTSRKGRWYSFEIFGSFLFDIYKSYLSRDIFDCSLMQFRETGFFCIREQYSSKGICLAKISRLQESSGVWDILKRCAYASVHVSSVLDQTAQ